MDEKYPFSLSKKTGFDITNPAIPVIIEDSRGKIFYDNSIISDPKKFNLPAGDYNRVSGQFRRLIRPVFYDLNTLPQRERNKSMPFDFEIKFEKNPYKCTINWLNKTITFDPALKELTLPELYFILFHEFGHTKYKTEHRADMYAENEMLKRGFNPSQIASAPITSLSHAQFDRKRRTVERLIHRSSLT